MESEEILVAFTTGGGRAAADKACMRRASLSVRFCWCKLALACGLHTDLRRIVWSHKWDKEADFIGAKDITVRILHHVLYFCWFLFNFDNEGQQEYYQAALNEYTCRYKAMRRYLLPQRLLVILSAFDKEILSKDKKQFLNDHLDEWKLTWSYVKTYLYPLFNQELAGSNHIVWFSFLLIKDPQIAEVIFT